jgi:hypothetical protein
MAELIAKRAYTLKMNPGILRDGTPFAKPNCSDGQWCRFYRGFPKKMNGYKNIQNASSNNIPTGLFVLPDSPNFNVYVGDSDSIGYTPIDFFGTAVGPFVDRTPVSPPFDANIYNQWQFDIMYSGVGNATITDQSVLIAFAAPNLASIDSGIQRPVYYGPAYDNSRLIPTGFNISGGIVVLHPYLLMLDNSGLVIITQASNPTVELNRFRIAPYKLLSGRPVRGGNTSPAGLIWSLDRLMRVTQTGTDTTPEWNFDTISAGISVMSSNSMVEYDTDYYWMGVDRFFYYNGVVQELPNDMNRNYVFNNINYDQRQKVWATKDTEWGEIWWHYPSGNSTECNATVIYNVREKTWYDSALSRSCGYYSTVFAQPIWAGNTLLNGSYPIWLQDEGLDQNVNGVLTAIPSFITTPLMSWVGTGPDQQKRGMDRWMSYYRIEPDFIQKGPMTCLITYQDYAQSTETYVSGPYVFNPDTVKIDINTPRQGRESTIKFMSDVIGGDYEMGEPVIIATIGDGRQSVPGE